MNLMLELLINKCAENTRPDWLCNVDIASAYDNIPYLLEIVCKEFESDKAFIHEFSFEHGVVDRFEYVDEARKGKRETDRELFSSLQNHVRQLQMNSFYLLRDIEDLKPISPLVYSILKINHVRNSVHVPIYLKGQFYGYMVMENFKLGYEDRVIDFMLDASEFFSKLLEQKKVLVKYKYLASHDYATGALNNYSFEEELNKAKYCLSLGVVYYNLFLQNTKSLPPEAVKDEIARKFYNGIERVFKDYNIFRVSCDEFIVLCPNIEASTFNFLLFMADKSFEHNDFLPHGSAFASGTFHARELIDEAKTRLHEVMQQDDAVNNNCSLPFSEYIDPSLMQGLEELQNDLFKGDLLKGNLNADNHFNRFINSNYFDIEFFFHSMSLTDHYPFFGDTDSNLFYISDKMKELFGFDSNIVMDLTKKWESRIPHSGDLEIYRKDLNEVFSGRKKEHNVIYRVLTAEGSEIWVECCGLVKFDSENNKPTFFSGFVKKMEYSFIIDPVSNMAREGIALLKIKELKDQGLEPTFIGFKLNYFDDINASKGRSVGNGLISDISGRLRDTFKDDIKFYRLDGLRFLGIVMPHLDTDIENLVDVINGIIGEVYQFYNVVFSNPCSIGMIDKDVEAQSAQEIISNIINVIELAKSKPDSKYFSYTSSDLQDKMQRSNMAIALYKNVAEDFENFRVVIQPVIRSDDMSIHSGELLLRWSFEGKDIPPSVFIPILEKSNLIIKVGRWVFEQAVKNVKRVRALLPDFKLNFNISYNQIKDDAFVKTMEELLKDSEVDASHLIMELTETHYNEDPNKLLHFIRSCKQLGLKIALDDFGSGYSSMELLLKYPSDIVKLDRSLINQISDSPENREFVNSIVYACHQFDKFVCVEGVETEDELRFALEIGCEMIQGYHFYKPMEIEDFYKEIIIEGEKG